MSDGLLATLLLAGLSACGSPHGGPAAGAPGPTVAATPPAPVTTPPAATPADGGPPPIVPAAPTDGGAGDAATPDTVTAASQRQGPRAGSAGVLDTGPLVAEHHRRMERDRAAPVVVLTERDPREAGRALCEAVVPRRPPETPVLVKPNLAGFQGRGAEVRGATSTRRTGTEFLRGVVRCLKARGHTKITIAEDIGAADADQTRWWRRIGMPDFVREEGVELVGLGTDGTPPVAIEPLAAPFAGARLLRTSLMVARILADHLREGLYVSVPKMKMHRFAVMSLGLKNAMGAILLADGVPPHRQKWRMHAELGAWMRRTRAAGPDAGPTGDRAGYVFALEQFAARIADVLEVELPDAVLIDGLPPVAGDGFDLDEPLRESVAIGSVNPVLADAVALEWMGYLDNADLAREIGHRTSPLVEEAARRFYGTTDVLSGIRIEGDASFRARRRVVHFRSMAGFEIGR